MVSSYAARALLLSRVCCSTSSTYASRCDDCSWDMSASCHCVSRPCSLFTLDEASATHSSISAALGKGGSLGVVCELVVMTSVCRCGAALYPSRAVLASLGVTSVYTEPAARLAARGILALTVVSPEVF